MAATVATVAYLGLEARAVEVQVQLSSGLPKFTIVGLADKAVAESRERVRAALACRRNAANGPRNFIGSFVLPGQLPILPVPSRSGESTSPRPSATVAKRRETSPRPPGAGPY